ncbi:MAG: DNA modification methylase [halophilic archaeon J07HX64]|nr:MAG: DNA modification methylase [halophilic archaeon J07HX64]
METSHRIFVGDSREMSEVGESEVELVVTSPPYPMIEMWDDLFVSLNPEIGTALDAGNGQEAFERMCAELETVWEEIDRVLVDGGIACINVGDATRKVDDSFRVYPNHARVTDYFEGMGFEPLPEILWRKPTNSAAKFMGSGMLPPNAYATLEHEYLLVFRNGKQSRTFTPGSERRYSSAYFWEERNEWFSDVWTGITGRLQSLDSGELRERSGAYPFEIPYRLVNMYSVYGDTVLDPFWGTGTTSLAAMVAGRSSVGYELQAEFTEVFTKRATDIERLSQDTVSRRLERHEEFVEQRLDDGNTFGYESEIYGFPVTTKQERQLRLYTAADINEDENGYTVSHTPYSG